MSLLPPVKENLSCGTVYKPTFQGQNRLEKELESIHHETDTWTHRQKALPLLLLSGGNALFPVLKDTVQQWDRYNHGVLSWAEFNHNRHYWLQFSFNFYLKITELILPQPFKFVMSKGPTLEFLSEFRQGQNSQAVFIRSQRGLKMSHHWPPVSKFIHRILKPNNQNE